MHVSPTTSYAKSCVKQNLYFLHSPTLYHVQIVEEQRRQLRRSSRDRCGGAFRLSQNIVVEVLNFDENLFIYIKWDEGCLNFLTRD